VALARQFSEARVLVPALEWAGLNLMHRGDHAAGLSMLDEAITVVAGDGDPPLPRAVALWFRAVGAIMDSDPAMSMGLLMKAMDICHAQDEKWMLSWVLVAAIPPAMMNGEPAKAGAFARECIPLHVALNDPSSLNVALNWLAGVAAAERDFHRVARLFGAERRLALAVGGSPFDTGELRKLHDDTVRPAKAALGDEVFDAEFQQGYDLPLEEAVAYATQPPR
jgi:non-specific serine/threonine protein kinase